ncbi:type IV secretory system conjugative DNA transfer family protein [Shinella sp.]|uniref:type IV secretory system conjugative DNA transfer family protein n=1 Tax=Shinella sp. TaxID=1870904 RepID=UPI003F708B3A
MAAQPSSPPWVAAVLSFLSFLLYRFLDGMGAASLFVWLFGALSALFGMITVTGLWRVLQEERLQRALTQPSGVSGRLDFPSADDAEEMGLSFSNEDGNGIPLGGTGDKIIYYTGPGHLSIRAPTNAGKTESSSASICFALGKHRNIIATAKGAELAYLCGPYRAALGQSVFYVDPWRIMRPLGMDSHDFNPIGHLVRYAGSPELLGKARESVSILQPEPDGGMGDNRIFLTQSRDLLSSIAAYLAIREAETGELCCNLPFLFTVICGSSSDLQDFLQEMRRCDLYQDSIRRAADRFLGKMERAAKTAESILTSAQDALQLYDPGGPLGRVTEYSDFDARDLKNPETPTTVFLIIPPEKSYSYGSFIGLCLNSLIDTCIEADRFEPRVTVVADEFANIAEGKLPAILPCLYVGRSGGVQLITYVQSTESYSRYGKEAEAFTTQSECVLAWSIRSTKDAEEYSKRSGQRSIMTENISTPFSSASGPHSISLSERAIPHMRPDEFMQMPDFTGVLFYRQHPPVTIDIVSYRTVDPWHRHARPMPGAPPLKDLPLKYKA